MEQEIYTKLEDCFISIFDKFKVPESKPCNDDGSVRYEDQIEFHWGWIDYIKPHPKVLAIRRIPSVELYEEILSECREQKTLIENRIGQPIYIQPNVPSSFGQTTQKWIKVSLFEGKF